MVRREQTTVVSVPIMPLGWRDWPTIGLAAVQFSGLALARWLWFDGLKAPGLGTAPVPKRPRQPHSRALPRTHWSTSHNWAGRRRAGAGVPTQG